MYLASERQYLLILIGRKFAVARIGVSSIRTQLNAGASRLNGALHVGQARGGRLQVRPRGESLFPSGSGWLGGLGIASAPAIFQLEEADRRLQRLSLAGQVLPR